MILLIKENSDILGVKFNDLNKYHKKKEKCSELEALVKAESGSRDLKWQDLRAAHQRRKTLAKKRYQFSMGIDLRNTPLTSDKYNDAESETTAEDACTIVQVTAQVEDLSTQMQDFQELINRTSPRTSAQEEETLAVEPSSSVDIITTSHVSLEELAPLAKALITRRKKRKQLSGVLNSSPNMEELKNQIESKKEELIRISNRKRAKKNLTIIHAVSI
ncbi:hypothetical protein FQR65_LT07192 [Abscondita terminalis]|nr:hypothetical protein FQR65_LT07192 [Abscondita terminalis]